MAIPFNLPSDEETAENYRRLDQLILDLYEVLRQILLRRRIERVAGPIERYPEQPQPQQPGLPDLVPQGRRPPVPPPRRRRRRCPKAQQQLDRQDHSVIHQEPTPQQGPSWLNVGIELRQIAEEFRSTQIGDGVEKKRREIKASSLFSLLVPAPLTGSIWTTVIILVGWRILARNRWMDQCCPFSIIIDLLSFKKL